MKSIVIVVTLLSLLISSISAQEKSVTLSGYVKDGKSGEVLIGATIYVDSIGKGATTNLYGYYSLTIPEGTYTVRYSFIGFEDLKKQIVLTADQRVSVDLLENSKVMKEVVIEGKANQNTENLAESSTKLHDNLMSESFARILINQGKKTMALEIYEKLILKFPEKRTYFADLIEKLKE